MGQKTRDASNRRDADASQPMDLTVGKAALQAIDRRPAIRHGLNLSRRAQVAKECPTLIRGLQCRDGGKKGTLSKCFLTWRDRWVAFHDVTVY
jgi:hypothetical protein